MQLLRYKGPVILRGAHISVPDLRVGFTYLIAAILARGRSIVKGIGHIERGYENLADSLWALGAQIRKTSNIP